MFSYAGIIRFRSKGSAKAISASFGHPSIQLGSLYHKILPIAICFEKILNKNLHCNKFLTARMFQKYPGKRYFSVFTLRIIVVFQNTTHNGISVFFGHIAFILHKIFKFLFRIQPEAAPCTGNNYIFSVTNACFFRYKKFSVGYFTDMNLVYRYHLTDYYKTNLSKNQYAKRIRLS